MWRLVSTRVDLVTGVAGGRKSNMNKYRNVKTEINGIVFDSKKEATRYSELKVLERTGYISKLELQYRFPLQVNGVNVCTYVADFYYLDKSGREVVEDTKGLKTAMYRLKAKLMIACYGLRILET